MKTIVLAGGKGTRVQSLTGGGNKHLLPLWDSTVIEEVTKDLWNFCIVTNPESVDDMRRLFPKRKVYSQMEPRGIVDAILSAKAFAYGEDVSVLLGDNLFSPRPRPMKLNRQKGAAVITVQHREPQRFGVAYLDKEGEVERLIEKPKTIMSSDRVRVLTGLYYFDSTVWARLYDVEMSERGEKEIMPVIRSYHRDGMLHLAPHEGQWTDIGVSPDSYQAVISSPENWRASS